MQLCDAIVVLKVEYVRQRLISDLLIVKETNMHFGHMRGFHIRIHICIIDSGPKALRQRRIQDPVRQTKRLLRELLNSGDDFVLVRAIYSANQGLP